MSIQRRLPNADRHLLKLLKEREGNVTRLARNLGVHRNTIHRRLRRMRQECPFEIESAPTLTGHHRRVERAELEAFSQQPSLSARQALRAKVLLAILDGRTYIEITQSLGVSTSTIARWRSRLAAHGIAGLKARHRGRKSSVAWQRLDKWLRCAQPGKVPSVRDLARRFGLSKSTVQRASKIDP